VSSAGVFFARPLVGSRWIVGQGPLAQKTPTLPNPLPVATRSPADPNYLADRPRSFLSRFQARHVACGV